MQYLDCIYFMHIARKKVTVSANMNSNTDLSFHYRITEW